MPQRVLNEDWEDYDNRKIRDRRDSAFFSCEEPWEVDYLVGKLRRRFPLKTDSAIKEAIATCCRSIPGNKPRRKFVECVVDRLQR